MSDGEWKITPTTVRLTPDELALLEQLGRAWGPINPLSRSDVIRLAIRRCHEQLPTPKEPTPRMRIGPYKYASYTIWDYARAIDPVGDFGTLSTIYLDFAKSEAQQARPNWLKRVRCLMPHEADSVGVWDKIGQGETIGVVSFRYFGPYSWEIGAAATQNEVADLLERLSGPRPKPI